MVSEGVEARKLGVDGRCEHEGIEGGPEVLEVGDPHGVRLGAGLDTLEGGLGAVVDAADPGPHPGLADELHGRQ